MYIIYGETDHKLRLVHETSPRAWCTGKTQRDQAEREVGGGDRDGEYMHIQG